MTEKEIKKLLKKANEERLFGEIAEALAILHRIHNEYPDDITYVGLLASTYYMTKEYDVALEYCDKADGIELDNPNTLDLRGLIAEDKGDKKLAEECYRKALQKDPLLVDCRVKLICLLYKEKRYEEVVEECNFIIKNIDTQKETYNVKEKTKIYVKYLFIVYQKLWQSLIGIEKYEEAIKVIHEYITSRSPTIKDPYFFDRDDDLLFKLYVLVNDKEGIDKYTDSKKAPKGFKIICNYLKDEFLKEDENKPYKDYMIIFYLDQSLYQIVTKDGKDESKSLGGFSYEDKVVLAKNPEASVVAHEIGHALNLPHSFASKAVSSYAKYTFESLTTDNIMDYSHMAKPKIPMNCFFYWQWKIMNNSVSSIGKTKSI